MSDEEYSDLQIYQALIELTEERKYYGQKYDKSKSQNELLLWLGEAVCISTIKIVYSLKPPRRGSLILKAMKVFSKSSYNSYYEIKNNLFAESLFYVVEKLKEAFNSWAKIKNPDYIIEQTINNCVAAFVDIKKMSNKEKEDFFMFMAKKQVFHVDNPPKQAAGFLIRIIQARGKVIDKKTLANFFKTALALKEDPLKLIELHVFTKRWNELSS